MSYIYTRKLKVDIIFLFALFLLFFSFFTNLCVVTGDSIERNYWPTTDWQTATYEEVNMNGSRIDVMFDYIDYHSYDIESLLIVKDGYLVTEEYFQGYTADTRHVLWSVTKSWMSTLIGIAIEEGYIDSVDQKILDFLYNASIPNIDLKENITISHLLTMTSGMSWNEVDVSYADPSNNETQMVASDNWVEYVLSSKMDYKPGTTYYYNTGGSHLLSAIIEKATGYSSLEYATTHIFNPLGITNISWEQDPQGIYFGGAGLELLPRDMAKFGFLFLNNGTWDGTQIVSQEWVQAATNSTIDIMSEFSYGYQWWSKPSKNYYFASGLYLQLIIVIPEYDLVVTITADDHTNNIYTYTELIDSFIVAAAKQGYNPSTTETTFIFLLPLSSLLIIVNIIIKRSR